MQESGSTPLDFLRTGGMAKIGVAILGDIVLDRYLLGSTGRVSREAPIPVVVCNGETDNLGGAGNVAMNLRGLGCQAFVAGTVGRDEASARVRHHLSESRIVTRLFERATSTLTKTRLLCGGQQVARFDDEKIEAPDDRVIAETLRWLSETMDPDPIEVNAQAVILSDYGLGFCTPQLCASAISAARGRDIPILVDPRGTDWHKYRGATVATPNLSELASVWGSAVPNEDRAIEQIGESVRRQVDLKWLLVTRSAQGMTLIGEDGALHVPARPVEVFDVSGAGDTVIACLAAGLAAGFSLDKAVKFANEAAQIVVTKSGTYPISSAELTREEEKLFDAESRQGRIVERNTAIRLCREWKQRGERVVFTNGCFDILHAGHADGLERARRLGDRLIVGLNNDRSVKALKGEGRPVNREEHRARLLSALRFVDLVVLFDEDTPAELLSELRPHVLVKGGDYRAETLPGKEFVEEVVILPLVEGLSTTDMIRRSAKTSG